MFYDVLLISPAIYVLPTFYAGWTIGTFAPGSSYSFAIYAAAGQCDITKGYLAGTFEFDYYGTTAEATFIFAEGYRWEQAHLYVGSSVLPTNKKGKFTVTPGQYTISSGDKDLFFSEEDITFTVRNLSGDVYVIGHAVSCKYVM